METTSVLTKHKFDILQQDETQLKSLHKQTQDMKEEFKHMTKKREKNVIELENKFQRSVDNYMENKQFIIEEYKIINQSLLEFQQNHDQMLSQKNESYRLATSQLNQEKFQHLTEIIESSKVLLNLEIEDRKQENKKNIQKLNKQILKLQKFHDFDMREQRVKGQQEIESYCNRVREDLDSATKAERESRIKRQEETRVYVANHLDVQMNLMQSFVKNTKNKLDKTTKDLLDCVNNRLNEQDKLIGNLENVVQMIQKTLKIIGNDPTL